MNNNEYYLAEIAKLYYTDKMKQNEIAKRFGITPMMVSRKLKEAEEKVGDFFGKNAMGYEYVTE